MNLGNLDKCMRVRLTTEQFDFLTELSGVYNISPSALLRMFIDSYMVTYNVQKEKGDSLDEDEQTILNDKL